MTERVSNEQLDRIIGDPLPGSAEWGLAVDLRDCRAKLAEAEGKLRDCEERNAYARTALADMRKENARLREERDAWRSATGLAGLTPEEAADKIDADDAERHRLREALMPFAEAADFDDRIGDATPVGYEGLTEGDLRRAKKALEGGDE